MKDSILILCHSNLHRSPFVAEYIRNSKYAECYDVRDAGFEVTGKDVPKPLQRAFQVISPGSLKRHKAKKVTMSDILWADKIVIMEPENKTDLIAMLGSMGLTNKTRYDHILGKVVCLASFAGKQAVKDPHHYSPETIEYGEVVLELAKITELMLESWNEQSSWNQKESTDKTDSGPFGS